MRARSASAAASRSRILATTVSGALSMNASLPSLARHCAASFSAAARSFVQPGPFGRDVDGAAGVQRDRHSAGRSASVAGGGEAVGRLVQPDQRPDQRLVGGEPAAVEPGQPGGDPLGRA